MAQNNVFLLAAENSPKLLPLLRTQPELASSQDEHGYSLMHAAASYNHLDLLRTLANELHVDVNVADEDGETSLFVVETVDAAQVLLEELKVDASITNADGTTAEEKIRTEGDYPTIADYLFESRTRKPLEAETSRASDSEALHMPRLPPNVTINVNSVESPANGGDQSPDPEFRRRIEELASRGDFDGELGQQELKTLVMDAVRGVGSDDGRETRRRLG
ncbi:hypothetical protein MMC13_008152 [Lambiella insularis]|nr:hypothetical protein [Lambiella insularis]